MKKNLIKSFLVIAILLGMFLVTGCKKDKTPSFNDRINETIGEVVEASLSCEMYDGANKDVLVYKLEKQTLVIVAGENFNARVITKISELDQSFNLTVSPKTEEIENISLEQLFNLDCNKNYFSTYEETEGGLTGVVTQENAEKFLKTSNGGINSDVNVDFILDGNRLISYSLSFTLNSGRTVSIKANYYYE